MSKDYWKRLKADPIRHAAFLQRKRDTYDPEKRRQDFQRTKANPELYERAKQRTREWYKSNREYRRLYDQRYNAEHKDTPEYRERMQKHSHKYYHKRNHKKEWRDHHLKKQIDLRNTMLDAYGAKCNCCGETIRAFLTLSHVNNDGAEERRKIGKNPKVMWRKAIAEVDSGRYELLCWNCNAGAKSNGGVCPHKAVEQMMYGGIP